MAQELPALLETAQREGWGQLEFLCPSGKPVAPVFLPPGGRPAISERLGAA
jgi:hypothetical protein